MSLRDVLHLWQFELFKNDNFWYLWLYKNLKKKKNHWIPHFCINNNKDDNNEKYYNDKVVAIVNKNTTDNNNFLQKKNMKYDFKNTHIYWDFWIFVAALALSSAHLERLCGFP